MLVNVTEKTKPRKFADRDIRRKGMFIQDSDSLRLSDAWEMFRNARGYFERLGAYEDIISIARELEGGDYILKPTDEERERQFQEKQTEKICSAIINALRNGMNTISPLCFR